MRRVVQGALRLTLSCALAVFVVGVEAQTVRRAISDVDLQRLANGVLGVMSFTVAPNLTTSALAIGNAALGNPGLRMVQLGGGFTWSKERAAWAGTSGCRSTGCCVRSPT